MAVKVSPFGPKPQFLLVNGLPAVANKLFFYVAGSVGTKQNTYTDSTGLVANTNPLILNTLGEPSTEIWFTVSQAYKVVYAPSTDTDPPTSPIWTIDNLTGINDSTTTIDQWIAFSGAPTFVSAVSFTLVGDQTSTFQIGRRVKTTNSGGTIYSTITGSAFAAVTTITVVNDSGTLDSGLSAVSYGILSANNDSVPRGIFPTIANVQKQTFTYFTTAGIATAFTLTPSPAISANTAGTKLDVVFHLAAGATPTLAVNGLAALPLKYYDATGTLQAVTATQLPINWRSPVLSDGTNWIVQIVPPAAATVIPTATNVPNVFLTSDNNVGTSYANVVNTGAIGASGEKWMIAACASMLDSGSTDTFNVRIWDGTTTYVETAIANTTAFYCPATISIILTLSAATTFHLSAKGGAAGAVAKATANSGGTNKATWINAVKLSP